MSHKETLRRYGSTFLTKHADSPFDLDGYDGNKNVAQGVIDAEKGVDTALADMDKLVGGASKKPQRHKGASKGGGGATKRLLRAMKPGNN